MKKINTYFKAHYHLSFWLQMAMVAAVIILVLLSSFVFKSWKTTHVLFVMIAFLVICGYFRLMWEKGYYAAHPERDKYSDQYVPAKERRKMKEQNQK